jgi:hypothetical protein
MDTYDEQRGYEGNHRYAHSAGAANAPNGRYGNYGHSELENIHIRAFNIAMLSILAFVEHCKRLTAFNPQTIATMRVSALALPAQIVMATPGSATSL